MKYVGKIVWEREFGRIGDWRVEKMGKSPSAKYGYLLSNSEITYLSVNPGPFESPEDRDDHILKDIYKRENSSK